MFGPDTEALIELCVMLSAGHEQIIVKSSSSSRKPGGFNGVYAALNAIIARADSDPRDFSGFKRDWTPTKVRSGFKPTTHHLQPRGNLCHCHPAHEEHSKWHRCAVRSTSS